MRQFLQSSVQLVMGVAVSLSVAGAEPGNAGGLPSVHEILEEALRTIHPTDVESVLKIARLQAKAGDRDAAKASLDRAVEVAEATISLEDTLLGGVAYLMRERLRMVVYLLDVASLQADLGHETASAMTVQKAVRAVRLAERPGDQVSALQDIALAQLSLGDNDAANSTLKEALQIANTLQDALTRKVRLLAAVAVRQAALGSPEASKATLLQAVNIAQSGDGSDLVTALAEIAAAEAKTGNTASARNTLERALQVSDGKKEAESLLPYKIVALTIVAEGLRDGGHRDAAYMMIKQALRLIESIKDHSDRSSALRTIALAQARLGDIDGALQSEKAIVEEMYKGQSLPYVAEAQIDKGDLRAALQTADAIGEFDPLRKESVLAKIANAYASTGNVQEATTTSKQIDHPFRASAFRAMGEAMARAGKAEQALAWASHQGRALEKAYILMGIAEGLLDQKMGKNGNGEKWVILLYRVGWVALDGSSERRWEPGLAELMRPIRRSGGEDCLKLRS